MTEPGSAEGGLQRGDRLGDYEIEGDLGEGGMARVYRARHVVLETPHAIKVLDPKYRADPEARRRFLDEARIQAKHLDHPGIVKVTNIIATADHAAIVMELIDGTSLEAEVSTLAARPAEVERIMLAVIEAVGAAHTAGIIHRDLKPANVLLAGPERRPKVADFGIAKVIESEGRSAKQSTHIAARMGTLSYMSPEQVRRAKNVTPRSDVFSLGAMFYELATGALPFDAETEFDVMDKIVNGRYQAPEDRNPQLASRVASVIRRALDPDPARRFGSCDEMAAAVRGEVVDSTPTAVPEVARRVEGPGNRGLRLAGLAAIAGLGVIGIVVAIIITVRRPDAPTAPAPAATATAAATPPQDADAASRPIYNALSLATPVDAPTAEATSSTVFSVPIDGSVVEGPADALVTVVVACDHASPFCARLLPTLAELRRAYPAELRIAYKWLIVHPERATVSALAVCAAGRQDESTRMNAQSWTAGVNHVLEASTVVNASGIAKCWTTPAGCQHAVDDARELGLDVRRFKADMQGCTLQLSRDADLLKSLNVVAAPTLFVNGKRLAVATDLERVVEAELAIGLDQIADGWARDRYYEQRVVGRGRQPLRPPRPPYDPLESAEILGRAFSAQHATVQHILLGWRERHAADPRGKKRTRAALERLVRETVNKLRAGAPIEPLMQALSEDPGSAASGASYAVTPDADQTVPFRNLALRLVGREVGVVRTPYGIHIIRRVD